MRNGPDKNPFRGVSDLLSRAAPAKRSMHFLSYFIDLLLVAIVSYLLFLGGKAIVDNNSAYKQNYANYESEITYYQDLLIDSHAGEYLNRDNHSLADNEDLSTKMMIHQILMSYTKDSAESPEFLENPLDKLKSTYVGTFYADSFTEASFDNDYISQFFVKYVPEHNENNDLVDLGEKNPTSYFISFFKNRVAKYDTLKFVYSSDDSALPYLKPEVANDIYKFLVRAEGSNRANYDNFVNFYSGMLTDIENLVFNAPSYQNGHYHNYLKYRQTITQTMDITLMLSIFIAYYIAVFLPMMIFKDGRSFGKIFLRLGVINIDKSEVEWWKITIRSIFAALSNIFIAFFLALLPPFNGSSLVLYLPFITIGSWDITFLNIIIIIFVLAAANGIFMLFTHEKRSLTDLIFKTMTVDVTLLDEPDYDEKDETSV